MGASPPHRELRPTTRRSRTDDVVKAALNEGKPLPLEVMLENMWRYRSEAVRLEALIPGDSGYDPLVANACRMAAQKCATEAAPYVHPKLANVQVRPEDEDEAAERRAARIDIEALRGRSVADLGRMYLQIAAGEQIDDAEIAAVDEDAEIVVSDEDARIVIDAEPESEETS